MRTRTLLLTIGIALMIGFAMLNVDEFTRKSTLNFGLTTMQLPFGLMMVMLVIAILLIFLVVTLFMQSRYLLDSRRYAKDLAAQRDLADKAEASRFTELRRYMEAQTTMNIDRDTTATASFDRRLALTEKLMLERLEQSDNSNAAYWGQHNDALMRNRPSSTF